MSNANAGFIQVAAHTNLALDRSEAALSVVSELHAEAPLRGVMDLQVLLDGLPAAQTADALTLFPGETSLVQSVVLPRVALWQPGGSSRRLYTARLTLISGEKPVDHRELRFGVRSVVGLPGGFPRHEPPRLMVNDVEVVLQGWIWDLQQAERPEVERFARAGGNLLYLTSPHDAGLYAACDALGVMVVQELPSTLSSAESEAVVSQLRHHPSLVAWVAEGDAGEAVDNEDPTGWRLQPQQAADLRQHCSMASRPLHVGARLPARTWEGSDAFTGEVWLLNRGDELSLLNVVATVILADGSEPYQENIACEAPGGALELAGDLYWRFPPTLDQPFVLSLEVVDEEGESLAQALLPQLWSPDDAATSKDAE